MVTAAVLVVGAAVHLGMMEINEICMGNEIVMLWGKKR